MCIKVKVFTSKRGSPTYLSRHDALFPQALSLIKWSLPVSSPSCPHDSLWLTSLYPSFLISPPNLTTQYSPFQKHTSSLYLFYIFFRDFLFSFALSYFAGYSSVSYFYSPSLIGHCIALGNIQSELPSLAAYAEFTHHFSQFIHEQMTWVSPAL